MFHDLIYMEYQQATFSKYNARPRTRITNKKQVVYANTSGTSVAMGSDTVGTSAANTSDVFLLYGT